MSSIRVGVDIGGTFTDLVAQRPDGSLHILKVTSTPANPGDAVITGLSTLLGQIGASMNDITEIVHGTTVGSNTILQKTGALTGVLTTRGFRDVLEIGRIRTPVMFDLSWQKPQPLSRRHYRLEVNERIGADGSVVTAIDDEDVRKAGRQFTDEKVEAVAVCFVNSYLNDAHERRALQILQKEFPGLLVTASCDVLPEIKEYERTSTTVVNAYLLKSMRRYLSGLTSRLAEAGLNAPLRVVSSHGAMVSAAAAADKPVFVVGSGPAGGVIGAAKLAQAQSTAGNVGDAIAFDLGGTTAKASLIECGVPTTTTEYEFRDGISTPSRFVKGGGYMLKVPAIDIAEVGAGGGSLAWIDSGGLLRVGPNSTGANPGPACYGLGNDQPTVTDANVVLGYLNPSALAGGSLQIQPELSIQAIQRVVAEPLGLSLVQAAHGIRHIANLEMARAIRTVSVERGRDTRDMTLIAHGGGGPVHAVEVATLLDIPRIVVTPMSGVFCSLGMLSASPGRPFVRSIMRPLDAMGPADFTALLDALHAQASQEMMAEGIDPDALRVHWTLDARYFGQSGEVSVTYEPGMSHQAIAQAFTAAYLRLYNHATDEPLELVNLRLTASASGDHLLDFTRLRVRQNRGGGGSVAVAATQATSRDAWFESAGDYIDVPVHQRETIAPGAELHGPAIVEAYDTTIVLPPHCMAVADQITSLTIHTKH